jgi:DNA-binding transcriptional MerR regulator
LTNWLTLLVNIPLSRFPKGVEIRARTSHHRHHQLTLASVIHTCAAARLFGRKHGKIDREIMNTEPQGRPGRDQTYSITDLCREFGVTPRTLRFYEQKGLLSPARRGWTRLFNYRDRARLQLILRGKRVGFALEEIKEMLDLYNLKDGQLTQLRVASTKLKDRLVGLRKQRGEIEEAIADLERTCDIVDGMLREREMALPRKTAAG